MLEFAVHHLGGYRLLARTCLADPAEISLLWELVLADRDRGLLASSEEGISGVGATLLEHGSPVYVGGAPVGEGVSVEGYDEVDVPGGRYAMVTYSGAPEHLMQVLAALREAASEAGESLSGDSIEVYREIDEEGRLVMDLGLRLAEE